MSFLGGFHDRRPYLLILSQSTQFTNPHYFFLIYASYRGRWMCTRTESSPSDFAGINAYGLLEVSETSSFAEIKAAFRKLAKKTHPDLAESENDPAASRRFIQILAAYEILSDSEKRAHYDRYLLSQRMLLQKHSRQGSPYYYADKSHMTTAKQMEVVEWLKWYRFAINEILSEKHVVSGSGYFDILEGEFYSAIHAAYYGPHIESMDLLPDCFEAEERSVYGTPEVLHLVSGRYLFGMVCIANNNPKLSHVCNEKLNSFASMGSDMCQSIENLSIYINSDAFNDGEIPQVQRESAIYHTSDAYKDLELHVCGKVVAMATRIPPRSCCGGIKNEDSQDHIHVFLRSHEDPMSVSNVFYRDSFLDGAGQQILLGTITGLGTTPEEGSCFVYNNSGTKTHVIMKHRTLLVKHMHWYQVGDRVSTCECRCSRAKLPPSKFWLFEPRCGMHDIGGWYVETFGRDKKGWTIPSRRYWDGFDPNEEPEKRLHPAIYLLTLAYRTLDREEAKRKRRNLKDFVEGKLVRLLTWCKKLV
ncbi:uncharacterized protein LOC131152701 [Malania oleifera]|uniref:uncharacterized protein LOC131152701 n=1 Tax=Malania oleifera TaxID=397392 RepID=UPI0025ADCA29|nr:uncharacterized protein LOC131152701 [Malania oleifera]